MSLRLVIMTHKFDSSGVTIDYQSLQWKTTTTPLPDPTDPDPVVFTLDHSYTAGLAKPETHETTGKYQCTDYHCASCCNAETNNAAYAEPLKRIGKPNSAI